MHGELNGCIWFDLNNLRIYGARVYIYTRIFSATCNSRKRQNSNKNTHTHTTPSSTPIILLSQTNQMYVCVCVCTTTPTSQCGRKVKQAHLNTDVRGIQCNNTFYNHIAGKIFQFVFAKCTMADHNGTHTYTHTTQTTSGRKKINVFFTHSQLLAKGFILKTMHITE